MWIILKVLLAVGAFFLRFISKHFDGRISERKEVDGSPFYLRQLPTKARSKYTEIGFDFSCRSVFKITRESHVDGFFKLIGLADEIQTGDKAFDDSIYVASDCSVFRQEIRENEELRRLVFELFADGCQSIYGNGAKVWFRFPGDRAQDDPLHVRCAAAYRQLEDLDQDWQGFFHDPFALKVLVAEGVVWGMAAYAAVGLFEWTYFENELHLNPRAMAWHSLSWGLMLAATLFALVVLLMRGSSRGHRIVVESFVVLGLSIPMGGIHLVSDINTNFDYSTPRVVLGRVDGLYESNYWFRGRGRHTIYLMHFVPENPEPYIPRRLQISGGLYKSLTKFGKAEIKIGNGRLQHPWIRSIEPVWEPGSTP